MKFISLLFIFIFIIFTIKGEKTNEEETEDLKCETFTGCNACTEKQGNDFRPIARGCIWCEQQFHSFCSSPQKGDCPIGNVRTFRNCAFSWIPIIIIILVFGFLFLFYGIFIMIIKQCEYKSYQRVISKNDNHRELNENENEISLVHEN